MARLWQITGALLFAISINIQPADAIVLNTDGFGNVTSVTGLTVGTDTYNVDFTVDTTAASVGLDFTNVSSATAAANALNAALNGAGHPDVIYPQISGGQSAYSIPYQVAGDVVTYLVSDIFNGQWNLVNQLVTLNLSTCNCGLSVADFQLANPGTTPLPAESRRQTNHNYT